MRLYDWNEELCRTYAGGPRWMSRIDHGGWAEKITRRLGGLPAGSTMVDVATGPGFLLVEMARRNPGIRLIAQDQAEPMLRIARAVLAEAHLEVETVCCPAERIEVPDATADVVMCKQWLHEAEDVDRVLAEMCRVLKPGGRSFVIDFGADGSRLAAHAVRALIFVTGGASGGFWRSFTHGLRGVDVRERRLKAGFAEVEYVRSGFNYLLVGKRGSPA